MLQGDIRIKGVSFFKTGANIALEIEKNISILMETRDSFIKKCTYRYLNLLSESFFFSNILVHN